MLELKITVGREQLFRMEDIIAALNKILDGGYNKAMGFKLTKVEPDGICEMEMPIGRDQMNPIGSVHGGAVFGLADTVGGYAIRAGYGHACTTVTSAIDYYNPTVGAKKLIGRAHILKHGKRMSSVEVTIYTEEYNPVAKVITRYFNLSEDFKAN